MGKLLQERLINEKCANPSSVNVVLIALIPNPKQKLWNRISFPDEINCYWNGHERVRSI